MTTLIAPIVALPVIFLISTLVSIKMEYRSSYWFFELFHLLSGFFVAMLFSNLLKSGTAILLATMAVGIFWEIWELIVDRQPRLKVVLLKLNIKQEKITWPDTALDLCLDLLGGIIFLAIR